jgi:rhodanese-related sulfurtransferase
LLAGMGILLAFMPNPVTKSFKLKPAELIAKSASDEINFSVDEVARFVNNEDSTVQLIDIRSADEFRKCNIPGSVNIPINDLLNPVWSGYFNQKNVRKVFYGNSDQNANVAWTIATGLGYQNCYVMEGGLNEWYKTVMLTRFEGETITPRENALFENGCSNRNWTEDASEKEAPLLKAPLSFGHLPKGEKKKEHKIKMKICNRIR